MSSGEFEPVLLRRINKPNSQSIETYKADGGYSALEKALKMKPEDVIEVVKSSACVGVVVQAFRRA